jgi:hypothetical protein
MSTKVITVGLIARTDFLADINRLIIFIESVSEAEMVRRLFRQDN